MAVRSSPSPSPLVARLIRLLESVTYTPPSSPKAVMADFYMLAWLGTVDPGAMRSPMALRLDLEDVRHAQQALLPNLQKELLRDVFYAMCCEIRHVADQPSNKDLLSPFLKSYYRRYTSAMSPLGDDRVPAQTDIQIDKADRGYSSSYAAVVAAARKKGIAREAVVREFGSAFYGLRWTNQYGGDKWGEIADGWLLLAKASSIDDMTVAIDHVYDLQHNTGSVFTKLKRYYDNGYDWIEEALDFKADLKSMAELVPFCSSQMKKLARPVLRFLPDAVAGTLVDPAPGNGAAGPGDPDLTDLTHTADSTGHITTYQWPSKPSSAVPLGHHERRLAQFVLADEMKSLSLIVAAHVQTTTPLPLQSALKTLGPTRLRNLAIQVVSGNFTTAEADAVLDSMGIWYVSMRPDAREKVLAAYVKSPQYGKSDVWSNGWWADPLWLGGEWVDGNWSGKNWLGGTWRDGVWHGGTWHGGTWQKGVWEKGDWVDGEWEGGTWTDGTWHDGTWASGEWMYGTWATGEWSNGVWRRGRWHSGMWHGGVWLSGTWLAGDWLGGTWGDGIWHNGTWQGGTWSTGVWRDGTWKSGIWQGGIWKGGTWEDGTWKSGIWQGGTWKEGTWHGGTWEGGSWFNGTWKGGTWKGGKIYNPATSELEDSDVNPDEFFKAKAPNGNGFPHGKHPKAAGNVMDNFWINMKKWVNDSKSVVVKNLFWPLDDYDSVAAAMVIDDASLLFLVAAVLNDDAAKVRSLVGQINEKLDNEGLTGPGQLASLVLNPNIKDLLLSLH